jgi:uncharacterized iron-regulated membrane protein
MRKVLFWLHLLAGCIAGLVILMMSVTGVLLTYERQTIAWVERDLRSTPGEKRLTPEELLAVLHKAGEPAPASLTLREDPTDPVHVSFGPEYALYLDAYSGAVLGQPAANVPAFFRRVTEWHRWFAAKGPSRATARAVTGACNLAFLALALSGIWLWMPRRWTWQHLRPVALFRGGLRGKSRDFNWHNVTGLWCVVPLIAITVSGAVMSYPWANDVVYWLTGTEAPRPLQRPGGAPERTSNAEIDTEGLNTAWSRAASAVPGWKAITLRLPGSAQAPWTFSIEKSHRGRPDLRSTLVLDRQTAAVVRHETFDTFNAGRRARSWLRFIHTGEAGGFAGQTVAGIASAGGCVLVWTGIALALRRLSNARRRPRVNTITPEYQETV